jgi:hypothetical protein
MSKSGALDLASGLGGKITKEEVKSAVDEYVSESHHSQSQLCVAAMMFVLFCGYCESPDDAWEETSQRS